ncbi:hypothetical protein [Streptomyces sp. CNQ085]|uniref:hypothetical protein n=1 Tax=Streptomyces sp. CNQ085 TaxID=2886944 RepID=UPI001F512194|nr:hypothetical protein [Streptomyces sp. CNQ085]MCI0384036.1 hypothetical protein [Streptomyces sp. CNQ085]
MVEPPVQGGAELFGKGTVAHYARATRAELSAFDRALGRSEAPIPHSEARRAPLEAAGRGE